MAKIPHKNAGKIDFTQLLEIEKESLEKDRAIQKVEAEGPTLEDALADAAILLDVQVSQIDYDILQEGFSGLMGVGKKDWRVQASRKPGVERIRPGTLLHADEEKEAAPVIPYRDSEAFVFRTTDGKVLLKVTPPSGGGQKVSETTVRELLIERKATDINRKAVSTIIREMAGEYFPVAEYEHHGYNDSVAKCEVENDDMKAYMTVTAPQEGGADISFDEYIATFRNSYIVAGIKEDFLREFIDKPMYDERLEIAIAPPAIPGRDAYIEYYFETDQSKMNFKESSGGKIDFKELNIIQNVSEGQAVAKKIPAEKGVSGRMVSGKLILTTDGKDIDLPLGTNTSVDEDGVTIRATIDGQVIKTANAINVEPVLTIEGDVSVKTGNIDFKGTVVVKGNVEDGFTVKATGNIEVNGNVGKANLDSEGDIVIHSGVNGKGGGYIKAAKSLWAKFIENANIETGNLVIASDGIINSQVSAKSRILVQGKRASIMGGKLRASEEINAKVLGSANTGMATICEVGYDPKKKAELEKLQESKATLEKSCETFKTTIKSLQNVKKQRGSLPKEKEDQLFELIKAQSNAESEIEKADRQIKEITEYLEKLKGRGKISASDAVHAGVKIAIRDQVNDINSTQHSVTFAMDEKGLIKAGKYEAVDESLLGQMEGYASPSSGSGGGGGAGSLDYKRSEPTYGDTADGIGKRARNIPAEEKKEKKGGILDIFKKGKKGKEEAAEAAAEPDKKNPLDVIKLIDEKKTAVGKK
jgi:uncharacterized protein (DUF342 family)